MNIYISRIDLQWNDKDLESLFTPFGAVESASVAIDGFTQKSRGFGHVEMPNEEEAVKAIEALNNTTVSGAQISVKEAEPLELKRGSYKVGAGAINPYRFRKN